jgi:hypothetical protein
MTPEEYWSSEGIRFLNEDGTLPSVEQRVKEGYQRGWENAWEAADARDHEEIGRVERLLLASALENVGKFIREIK